MTVYQYKTTISASLSFIPTAFTTANYVNYSRAGKFNYKSTISSDNSLVYNSFYYRAYYIFYQRIEKYIGYSKNRFLM